MKKFFSSLFWKISLIFLVILIIISGVYVYISVFTAEMYFQETRQKLDTKIAEHIAADNKCFTGDSVNTDALKNVFHSVMVINPSIEVYLLNTKGKILTYYAPDHIVKLEKVPLDPVHEFIDSEGEDILLGPDPKNPDREKVFSAAPVVEEGKLKGYIYVILGSQEYENASQLVFGSYILRLGVRSMMIALVTAAFIGFLAIGFITRNIREISTVIKKWQQGKLDERITTKSTGELKEFADTFNQMADTIVSNIDEIKNMDKLRRELVANVSHDLRTPLSIIRGYIETILIKEDNLSQDERKKFLETILSSTDRLLKLVEELFELSKLEAKDKVIQREELSLAELLQDIHQKNLVLAGEHKIKLTLETEKNIPMIKADISLMEKVFQNLIDNAMKFTPQDGEITLSLKTDNNKILTSVSDTGVGIKESELPFVFDRYYQIQRVSEKEKGGVGLGLAIVKKIIDLHGFHLIVESEENSGTNFTIIIPCKA